MNFAQHIIEECTQQGITEFCFAPGSRSTPLIVALSQNKKAVTHIHFDERGLAFFALGLAKKKREPVALITTSGSAVGNLLPALMEADSAAVPLILITADRPFELRGCGANQTTHQVNIFEPFTRYHVDIPASDTHLSERAMHQTIAHAIYRAKHTLPGPVHINCQFREPFLPLKTLTGTTPSITYSTSTPTPTQGDLKQWAESMTSCKNGVIIAGTDAFSNGAEALTALAKRLQWPILADPLSGVRCDAPYFIPYFNHILLSKEVSTPDAIIHCGDRCVSKTLLEWIEQAHPSFYGLIAPHPFRHDPLHLLTHRMTSSPDLFCQEILSHLPEQKNTSWLNKWIDRSDLLRNKIDSLFAHEENISEPGLFHFLQTHIPTRLSLFVANSMPIRDTDLFFFPKTPLAYLTANRGVSGIDGNLATAAACADIAILGDLATLHDLNSLSLIKQRKRPLILLVINNQGGGIFSFLPIAKGENEIFESHFATAHPYTFKDAASLFGIPYAQPQTKEELEERLLALFKTPKTCLIEINTDREKNHTLHQTIKSECSTTQ